MKILEVIIVTFVFSSIVTSKNIAIGSNNFVKNAKVYNWQILRVVDGDTLEIANEFLPEELKLFVRIKGIDTPEKAPRSKCRREEVLAQKATDFTKKKVEFAQTHQQKITFSEIKWDKYGGRILAKVSIDEADLASDLVRQGLAREYFGDKKKGWCNN